MPERTYLPSTQLITDQLIGSANTYNDVTVAGVGVIIATTILMLMLENHLPTEVAEVPVIGEQNR